MLSAPLLHYGTVVSPSLPPAPPPPGGEVVQEFLRQGYGELDIAHRPDSRIWIGGVAGVTYRGTDPPHFHPVATECLWGGEEAKKAFSGCRMEGIGSSLCHPCHPSYLGAEGSCTSHPSAWDQVAIGTPVATLLL